MADLLCAPCGVGVRCDRHDTPGQPQAPIDRAALAEWETLMDALPDVAADVTDDGRRWWVVGARTWTGTQIYEARSGRNALAAYRRDLIAADRSNGYSRRHATDIARVAELCVIAGPLTTPIAYQHDLGQALADEVCRWKDYDITAPIGPIQPADMAKAVHVLGADTVERLRRQVLAHYTPADTDG